MFKSFSLKTKLRGKKHLSLVSITITSLGIKDYTSSLHVCFLPKSKHTNLLEKWKFSNTSEDISLKVGESRLLCRGWKRINHAHDHINSQVKTRVIERQHVAVATPSWQFPQCPCRATLLFWRASFSLTSRHGSSFPPAVMASGPGCKGACTAMDSSPGILMWTGEKRAFSTEVEKLWAKPFPHRESVLVSLDAHAETGQHCWQHACITRGPGCRRSCPLR